MATVTINSISVRPASRPIPERAPCEFRLRIIPFLTTSGAVPLLDVDDGPRRDHRERLLFAVPRRSLGDAHDAVTRGLGLKRKDAHLARSAHASDPGRTRGRDGHATRSVIPMHQRHGLAVMP